MEEKLIKICEKIRALRHNRKWSQEYLGSKLGLTQQSLTRIENGKAEITVKKVFQFAEIFGVDPAELLGVGGWDNEKVKGLERQVENCRAIIARLEALIDNQAELIRFLKKEKRGDGNAGFL